MKVKRNGWQWEKGWLGLISWPSNWEENGPHMLCLTSQSAGERGRVGEECVSVCDGRLWKLGFSVKPLHSSPNPEFIPKS